MYQEQHSQEVYSIECNHHKRSVIKRQKGAGERNQWGKALASKAKDLSSISRSHMEERDIYTCCDTHVHKHVHTHINYNNKNKCSEQYQAS